MSMTVFLLFFMGMFVMLVTDRDRHVVVIVVNIVTLLGVSTVLIVSKNLKLLFIVLMNLCRNGSKQWKWILHPASRNSNDLDPRHCERGCDHVFPYVCVYLCHTLGDQMHDRRPIRHYIWTQRNARFKGSNTNNCQHIVLTFWCDYGYGHDCDYEWQTWCKNFGSSLEYVDRLCEEREMKYFPTKVMPTDVLQLAQLICVK